MCKHVLWIVHGECCHLTPAPRDGINHHPPIYCDAVRAWIATYHQQPVHDPAQVPIPSPRACPVTTAQLDWDNAPGPSFIVSGMSSFPPQTGPVYAGPVPSPASQAVMLLHDTSTPSQSPRIALVAPALQHALSNTSYLTLPTYYQPGQQPYMSRSAPVSAVGTPLLTPATPHFPPPYSALGPHFPQYPHAHHHHHHHHHHHQHQHAASYSAIGSSGIMPFMPVTVQQSVAAAYGLSQQLSAPDTTAAQNQARMHQSSAALRRNAPGIWARMYYQNGTPRDPHAIVRAARRDAHAIVLTGLSPSACPRCHDAQIYAWRVRGGGHIWDQRKGRAGQYSQVIRPDFAVDADIGWARWYGWRSEQGWPNARAQELFQGALANANQMGTVVDVPWSVVTGSREAALMDAHTQVLGTTNWIGMPQATMVRTMYAHPASVVVARGAIEPPPPPPAATASGARGNRGGASRKKNKNARRNSTQGDTRRQADSSSSGATAAAAATPAGAAPAAAAVAAANVPAAGPAQLPPLAEEPAGALAMKRKEKKKEKEEGKKVTIEQVEDESFLPVHGQEESRVAAQLREMKLD